MTIIFLMGIGIVFGERFFFEALLPNQVLAEEIPMKYVSITKRNFIIYQDYGKTMITDPQVELNQTFRVEEEQTQGIVTYLALSDANGFVGYIDQASVTEAVGAEGIARSIRRYVKVIENRELYQDFSWNFDQETEALIDRTFRAKAMYHHYNGDIYYELYDEQDEWVGYVEESALEKSDRKSFLQSNSEDEKAATNESEDESETDVEAEQETVSDVVVDASSGTMSGDVDAVQNPDKHFIAGSNSGGSARVQRNQSPAIRQAASIQRTARATWTNNETFIEEIASAAQELANEYGLYASVMIAQAALESGYGNSQLAREANNLFGIKYSRSDSSRFEAYEILSDEFVNGVRVTLPATFRKYATVSDSLLDNAKLLANGLSGNATFYQGSWRVNAASYQEATRALTGKYATDPEYDAKLNRVIENWDLTQYD